jgi:Fanconi-associated nuclease 1
MPRGGKTRGLTIRGRLVCAASGAASDDEDFVADAAANDDEEDDDFRPEKKPGKAQPAQRGAAQSAPPKRKRKATAAAPAAPAAAKRPMAAFFGGAAAKREIAGAGGSGAGAEQALCPVCDRSMPLSAVNAHLDACLSRGGAGAGSTAAPAATPRAAALPVAAAAQRTPPPARAAVFAPSPLQHGGTSDAADVASPLASQATPGGSATLLAPLAADEPLTWPTPELRFRIAGRRFHRQAGAAAAGAAASLRREPSNAADANAILIAPPTTPDAPAYGHVPACVAEHLAPLLDRGWLRVECALPDGAAAGSEASSGDAPSVVARGFANTALNPRAGAALRAGWAAALAAAAAANDAGGRLAAARRSFCLVAQTVLRRDAPLFPRRHAPMLAAAAALDADAQTLLLQMYSRKGPWFRISTLQYADVPDADAAVDALSAAGLARSMPAPADGDEAEDSSGVDSGAESENEEADRRSRYSVLTAPELRAAAASAGCASAGGRRDDALVALARAAPARAEAAWTAAAKRCVRLRACARASLRRAFLLFFLAPGADVARFLLVDIGAITYPRYALRDSDRDDVACRVFPSRAAVDAFEAASRRRDALHVALEASEAVTAARLAAEAATALRIDAAALCSLAGAEQQGAGPEAEIVIDRDGDEVADDATAYAPQFARFRAAHLHASVCSEGVALLERARRYADAVALLRALLALRPAPRPTHRGSWWLRLCTDLEHLGRADCALAAAESGLEDGACGPADVAALRAKVLRLAVPPRRWKPPAWAAAAAAEAAAHAPRVVRLRAPPALRSVTGRKSLFAAPAASDIDADAAALHAALPADATAPAAAAAAAALALADADAAALPLPAIAENDISDDVAAPAAPDAVTVEALALAHYAAQGWRGSHAESGVWLTLFGLLFWQIIFPADTTGPLAAPRGVFQSAFQTAPLDFGTAAFAEARRDALSARLARIAAGDAPRLIAATWAAHRGAAAAGVSWRAHSLEELQAICEGVGPMPLAALMRLLASDYAGWRAGLPDLVLWRGAAGSREAMLVEVKGTRDTMRPGQRAWATALGAAGIRMEILQYE